MAYSPAPIQRESVISQATQEICRFIEAERLSPGDALPPETRLSEMLGISRNSVREALRVLHGLGYVEKAAGRRVVVTASSQGGKSMFDESVLIEAAPIANDVRSHIAQKCAELSAERLTAMELGELERSLAALEAAIARQDMAAAKSAHDAFHGLLLASARNPLLVAMFNQAQVARLSNVSPEHKSFYDPRHLAHHRALLRALRRRDARAARAVVRKHFQSLGLMLEFVTRARRKTAQVVPLASRRAARCLDNSQNLPRRPGRAKRVPGPIRGALSRAHGVWVPAFAGTTGWMSRVGAKPARVGAGSAVAPGTAPAGARPSSPSTADRA